MFLVKIIENKYNEPDAYSNLIICGGETMSECPRCKGKSINLGQVTVAIGKTRGKRVNVNECVDCKLLFYEALEEE